MTANTFQENIQKCPEAGMCAHLAKPMNVEKLKHTIRSQIHKE